jgi:hypothetical protein
MEAIKAQRDLALSILAEADARILELTIENERLRALAGPKNVSPIQVAKLHST